MALNYKKVDFWGFDFEIDELYGHATLYIYRSPYDNSCLYKYVDEEHGISSGGYLDPKQAKKVFKNKIKELAA